MPEAPAASLPWRRWNVTPREAVALQRCAALAIEPVDRLGDITTIAGVDVAYGARGRGATARAAAVLLDLATLVVLGESVIEMPATFPYVPGLLTFREAPAAVAAIEALPVRPDLLLCDGQGIAHPRRCGVASHLGLALDLPTIGVAKSRLIGRHVDPAPHKGAWTPLLDNDDQIGVCLRTKAGVKPLFVSIGHRVSLQTAVHIVLHCSTRWRLPEPTRLADRLSKCRRPDA
ncbi:MAG: deoxyribonuclease V [Rhodospirillales bacterium]|nr:deoxyribonuclease V [Rhodospirillales bacterium]